jgi:predicted O-linked N-acetylglucosamine transferase (SPINDLY family)
MKNIPAPKPHKPLNQKQPSSIRSLLTKAFDFHQKGDLIAAGDLYAQILKVQPQHFDALQLTGLIAAKNGQHDVAIQFIQRALLLNPKEHKANNNLGIAYYETGKYKSAVQSFSKAIASQSRYLEAFYNRGMAYQALQELELARIDYEMAYSISPFHIGVLTNLGNVLQLQKNYEQSLEFYGKVIAYSPNTPEPFNNRGNLFHELQKYSQALSDFDVAISINPQYAEAYSNRGNTLQILGQYDSALSDYNQAIFLNEKFTQARQNRANLLCEIGLYEDAIVDLENIISTNSKFPYIRGIYLATKMRVCNWENFSTELAGIEASIAKLEKVSQPFWVLPITDSIILQKKAAQVWVEDKHSAVKNQTIFPHKERSKKIKVAYFSADFHNHATMYLMAQLFEQHDKEKFEIIGFSFGPDYQDQMRARAIKALDQFYDVRFKTDYEVAKFSREIGIDIAVDLKGYTLNYRAGIFENRAAPIQLNYLGYPGTMAANFIDFIVADKFVIPEIYKNQYSEKVVYMPTCYQVNDESRKISKKQFTRAEMGLPAEGFVFCCFNNNYKITPSLFDSWMNILKSVNGSVLWLLEDNSSVPLNLRKEARYRGVNPSRIIFSKRLSLEEHLSRHQLANLFLDTFPCNAHTTASDSLWAGLPVLTRTGEAFASRVAGSLLNAVGLNQLVVDSQADYEKTAILLAKDSEKLVNLKQHLKNQIKDSPLFNIKNYTNDLEEIYLNILDA